MSRKTEPRFDEDKTAAPAGEPTREEDLLRLVTSLLAGSDLSEIEIEKGDLRIRAARAVAATVVYAAPVPAHPPPPPAPAPGTHKPERPQDEAPATSVADHPGAIKSPMVGTAYLRPSPDARTFVEVGSRVSAGDKLLLIEAMKTFNDIVAHRAGVVTAVLVEDGQPVEYGEPLMVIE